jgi:spermidine synthase
MPSRHAAQTVVLAALLLSGVAGIINQVVWQRALKMFLGGSETMSALVVVLVFMMGLGIGSGLIARRAPRSPNPLREFGFVELGLFAVNTAIAILLSLDLAESVYAVERLAVSVGFPIRLIYGIGALGLLLPPTLLMGATLPLASEACQRQLGATQSSLITILFSLNTLGACVGAAASSFYLLPFHGQRAALIAAAAFNLLASASIFLIGLGIRSSRAAEPHPTDRLLGKRQSFSLEEKLGTALGFLALGYEMYVLRLVSLAHQPLPYTFAFTLFFYLLFWSIGVWVAGRIKERLGATLVGTALLVAAIPRAYFFDRYESEFSLFTFGLVYFIPCVGFGLLYGALVSRSVSEWGRDVGRFYALNTFGSCCGIVFFTLIGYEIPHDYNAIVISLGLVAVLLQLLIAGERVSDRSDRLWLFRSGQAAVGVAAAGLLLWGVSTTYSMNGQVRTFWGRDGVVEVHPDGDIWIDGLWHSALSRGESHIGTPYSWMLAVAAVLAHREDEPIQEALVVGNGIGITASTLAKLGGVHVDAYEINHTLKEVLERYPEQTLGVASDPKIDIYWTDGRSGLALNDKRYDLIISAPLYLRQAGSSILLSQEYMELAKSRLTEFGVFALYSHEGALAQSSLVHATVGSVFDHTETFLDGLLTVASDTPIEINREGIARRPRTRDPFFREARRYDLAGRKLKGQGIYEAYDAEEIRFLRSDYLVTDDHPLVEYPAIADRLLLPASEIDREAQSDDEARPPS